MKTSSSATCQEPHVCDDPTRVRAQIITVPSSAAWNLERRLFIFFIFLKNIYLYFSPLPSLINYLQMTWFCIWFSTLWLSTNSEWIINDVCCSEQTIKFSRLSKPNGISSRRRRLCSNTSAPLFFFLLFLLLLFVRAPENVSLNWSLRTILFLIFFLNSSFDSWTQHLSPCRLSVTDALLYYVSINS